MFTVDTSVIPKEIGSEWVENKETRLLRWVLPPDPKHIDDKCHFDMGCDGLGHLDALGLLKKCTPEFHKEWFSWICTGDPTLDICMVDEINLWEFEFDLTDDHRIDFQQKTWRESRFGSMLSWIPLFEDAKRNLILGNVDKSSDNYLHCAVMGVDSHGRLDLFATGLILAKLLRGLKSLPPPQWMLDLPQPIPFVYYHDRSTQAFHRKREEEEATWSHRRTKWIGIIQGWMELRDMSLHYG